VPIVTRVPTGPGREGRPPGR